MKIAVFSVSIVLTLSCRWVMAASADPPYSTLSFTLPALKERMVVVDLDGDQLKDVLCSDEAQLYIYFQRVVGATATAAFDFSKPDLSLRLPGASAGWAVDYEAGVNSNNPAGAKRLVALIDSKRVLAWSLHKRQLSEPQTLLENVGGFLPQGAMPVDFVRDADGDGLMDLIFPGNNELLLYSQKQTKGYSEKYVLRSAPQAPPSLSQSRAINDAVSLGGFVGQTVTIPLMTIRDTNNDDRRDLIINADELTEVYLAQASGQFPVHATYQIDMKAVRERVGKPSFDKIDFSNLTGMLAYTTERLLADVDNDKIDDLVLREGGKVSLYSGTVQGIRLTTPTQIIKSGGNVLAMALADEDGDGRKDLWLTRIEEISVGSVFVWLAVAKDINLETYVYKNDGQRFASRPYKKLNLSLKVPSLLGFLKIAEQLEKAGKEKNFIRSVSAALDGKSEQNDLLALRDDAVVGFFNKAKAAATTPSKPLFGLYESAKTDYVFSLDNFMRGFLENSEYSAVKGMSADFSLTLPATHRDKRKLSDVFVLDLNGDQRDDIFVFYDRKESSLAGTLFISH